MEGVLAVATEPLPIVPKVFLPQQAAVPPSINAHDWSLYALSSVTAPMPGTAVGVFTCVATPLPSWP